MRKHFYFKFFHSYLDKRIYEASIKPRSIASANQFIHLEEYLPDFIP